MQRVLDGQLEGRLNYGFSTRAEPEIYCAAPVMNSDFGGASDKKDAVGLLVHFWGKKMRI